MAAWTRAYDAPEGSKTREAFLDSIGVRGDRADRSRFFADLSTEMLADEMNMRRDDRALKDDPKAFHPRVHEVSARDARRLDVTQAALKHGAPLGDNVSDQSLRDTSGTGMRADIAQSMAAHTGQRDQADIATEIDDLHDLASSETLA